MSTVPQQSSLLSTVLEAGVSKACFHVATELIFEELSAGRGVTLPGLGTFTIDVKERFLGTGRGTKGVICVRIREGDRLIAAGRIDAAAVAGDPESEGESNADA